MVVISDSRFSKFIDSLEYRRSVAPYSIAITMNCVLENWGILFPRSMFLNAANVFPAYHIHMQSTGQLRLPLPGKFIPYFPFSPSFNLYS